MSSSTKVVSKSEKARFVKIKRIHVTDYKRESKFRVVLKHKSGGEETWETSEKDHELIIKTSTFIPIGPTSQIQVFRADLSQRSVPEIKLKVNENSTGDLDLHAPVEYGMTVKVTLGEKHTGSVVASSRLQQTMKLLRAREKIMDRLETGAKCLKLFVNIGGDIADLNEVSKAIVQVVRAVYKRMENITEVYRRIRDLTMDLVDAVEDACMTRRNFKSSEVSSQLDKLIDLVIRVSEKLSTYYAKKEKTIKDLLWIRNEDPDVEGLSQELVRLKARIQYAYLNEMQSGIVHMQADLTKMLDKLDGKSSRRSSTVEMARKPTLDTSKKHKNKKIEKPKMITKQISASPQNMSRQGSVEISAKDAPHRRESSILSNDWVRAEKPNVPHGDSRRANLRKGSTRYATRSNTRGVFKRKSNSQVKAERKRSVSRRTTKDKRRKSTRRKDSHT